MAHHLAQVNVGRLVATLDDPQLEGFVAALDPVNAVADSAPGFVWRLQSESGNATDVEAFGWDRGDSVAIIVNMSVWTDLEHLTAFVYSPEHREVLRQRRQWFVPMKESYTACWWVPAGDLPTTEDAEERVRHLRQHGPTPWAFTMREHFTAPSLAPDQALGR
jgi:Domain of unknown function (DUF3291)